MIFSIVIILMLGVIGYFYYVQGFFTSLLTAASAVIAAVMAVSYHENLADLAFKNRFTDEGVAFSLELIFAIVFVTLRLTFDGLIPGNIRLPNLMDRVGGAIFGLITGVFALGVFAIAAQSLPFGPTIMMQSRFKTVASRDVHVPGVGQASDTTVNDELASDKFTPEDRQSLYVPVDEWVLGTVSYLSTDGSLAGDRTLTSVHPNYLDELFGERIGLQPGSEHIAVNTPGHEQASVSLAYLPTALAEADAEIGQIRNGVLHTVKPTLTADGSNVILVLRVLFGSSASDEDKLVRFSTGAIHLVAAGNDYYPLGTLDESGVLRMNKPDDPLFVSVSDADHAADVVFYVPKADVLQGGAVTKTASGKEVSESFGSFVPGVFLTVKRMARIDLSSLKISPPQSPDKILNVIRKPKLPAPTATVAAPVEASDDAPFSFDHMDVSATLPKPIALGLLDGDNASVTFASGTAELRGKKFARLTIKPVTPLADLPNGDNAIDQLFVPAGMKAVQLAGFVPPKADDPWGWAEHLDQFSVIDASDKAYKASGVISKVMKSVQPMLVGAYDADAPVNTVAKTADVRPTDVTLIFLVPDSSTLKELDYQGKRLTPLNKSVDSGG